MRVIDDWVTAQSLGLVFECWVGKGQLLFSSLDSVVSALSALPEADSFSRRKLTLPHTLATTMRHTIAAMQELGLRRLVPLSSIGVGDSRPYAL